MRTVQLNKEEESKFSFSTHWNAILLGWGFTSVLEDFQPSLPTGKLGGMVSENRERQALLFVAGIFNEMRITMTWTRMLLTKKASQWFNLILNSCVVLLIKNRRLFDPDTGFLSISHQGLILVFWQAWVKSSYSFRPANS